MPLLGSGDYRFELQSWLQTRLIAAWGSRASSSSPPRPRAPCKAATSSLKHGAGARGCGAATPSPLAAGGGPRSSARPRLPCSGPRLPRQVEISPFKPARANQSPARPAVPTRGAARSPAPARSRHRTPARGARDPAARVTDSNTSRASGYRAPALPAAGTPWSDPCTGSPSAAGAPTPTCPSTSAPMVSACGPGCTGCFPCSPRAEEPALKVTAAGSRRFSCLGHFSDPFLL